jgi:CcmD family protein
MSDLGFLALGYGLIWVIIGAYVWFVSRRQEALRRQLEGLQMEVDEAAKKLAQDRSPADAG